MNRRKFFGVLAGGAAAAGLSSVAKPEILGSRFEKYEEALRAGIMTPNQARELANRPIDMRTHESFVPEIPDSAEDIVVTPEVEPRKDQLMITIHCDTREFERKIKEATAQLNELVRLRRSLNL